MKNRNRMPDLSNLAASINAANGPEAIQVLAEQLCETKDVVAEMLTTWSEFSSNHGDLRASVQQLQQEFVKLEEGGGSGVRHFAAADAVGARAAEKFQKDPSFKAAAEAAGRGMKPGQFESRVNVDGSIRATLVTEEGFDGGEGFTTTPGRVDRTGTFGPVLRPLRLLDALPSRPTDGDIVEFVQITATGEAAEQVEEGDEKQEIEFEGDLASANIVTIAGHTTASKQVLSSSRALGQVINRVLNHKVRSRLENQLVNGPGGQGRIQGLLVQAPMFVPTIGVTPADIYGEALVRLADAGYSPNLALMNPLDWFRLQITRTADDEESYVFGSPTMPVPPALWNTRIVLTPTVEEGMGLVLDTSFTTVLDREQLSIAVSNSHKDNFTKNLVTILAELRAGLEVTDQNALRKFVLEPAPVSV